MRLFSGIIFLALTIASAQPAEIKLDESWIQKIAQLCTAAAYGSRMTAEPICRELQQKFTQAMGEEQAAKAKEEADKAKEQNK